MACKLPFKTAEANSKSWLRTRKVIDKYLNILDLPRFRKLNKKIREYAKKEYGVDEQMYFEEQGGTKALPNKAAFRKIDEAKGIIYKQKVSEPTNASDKAVEDKLKSFLSRYGIGLRYVDSLKERGYDAVAISDITNRLILIAKKEADETTLPEEVAHIAVELLGEDNPIVKKLLEKIENTEIYKDTYEEYKADPEYLKDGKPDTYKIKKEAIGKAIGKQIIKKGKGDKSILGNIKMLWNKIMSLFKKISQKSLNEELNSLTGEVAKNILEGDLKTEVKKLGKGVFKQKATKGKVEKVSKEIRAAEKVLKTIIAREKQLKHSKFSNEEILAKVESTQKHLKFAIAVNQGIIGMGKYLDMVKTETDYIVDKIEDYLENKSNDKVLVASTIQDMYELVNLYKPSLHNIRTLIENDKTLRQEGSAILDLAEALENDISRIERFADSRMEDALEYTLSKELAEEEGVSAREIMEVSKEDTSSFRLWLGSVTNAKDAMVRIIGKILRDIKLNVDRYTIGVGKKLTAAQVKLEKTGFKDFDIFYEKYTTGNNKGKKTGNIITKYNMGEYFKAKRNVMDRIAKQLKVEAWTDIPHKELRDKNPEVAKIWGDEWKAFHKKHSVVDKKEGILRPNDKYLNKAFTTLSKEAKEYYDVLIDIKKEADKKLPTHYQKNASRMPMIRKDDLERIKSKEQNIFTNVKEVVSERFTIKEDETDYGHRDIVSTEDGGVLRMVPVHYVSRLENMDNLSNDISSIYIAYAHMAENFKQKSKSKAKLELLHRQVGERQLRTKDVFNRVKEKEGKTTNTYKMIDMTLQKDLYGEKSEIKYIKIGNKTINLTKVSDAFNNFVRRVNLAFNPFTHTASYITGSTYSKIEDIAGRYTTQESKLWAEKELDANMVNIMMQAGKRLKTNKVALLYEYNGISNTGASAFKNLNFKTSVGRLLSESGVYSTYEAVDYRVKGKILLAIYDNYRLIDGKYITKSQYKILNKERLSKAEINSGWKAAKDKSLYNAYEVKNNELVIKNEFKKYIDSSLENKVNNRINQITAQVDGRLNDADRSNLYRYEWGRLIMTHRGWIISGVENRWKPETYNYTTGEMEEGYHRTFFNTYIRPILFNRFNFKQVAENYSNLKEHQKANLRKAYADMAFIAIAMATMAILNGLAEGADDDDDAIQFLAYMSSRVKLEADAFTSLREIPQILTSPAAGINQVENTLDLFHMLYSFDDEGKWRPLDVIDRGRYKGLNRLEKTAIKMSILKNFYEFNAAEEKNRYLKQMVLQ